MPISEYNWVVICIDVHRYLYFPNDENQQAPLKDPLHVPVGPITRARSKKIKEALNGLIQEIWGDPKTRHSKLGPKEDECVINLIQAIDGCNSLAMAWIND